MVRAAMHMSRRTFLGLAGALAWSTSGRASAEDDPGPGLHVLGLDHERDGLLYLPRGYTRGTPAPLMVLFHGAGGTAQSVNYAFPMADTHGVIILAPDSRDQRTWDLILGEYGPDADFLAAALGQTFRRCAVDRSRHSLGGHSDGASYALSFGIGVGDLFQRILAFAPGVMRPQDVKGKPRLFIGHGTRDAVMPIDDTSRRFVPRLRALGYDVTYREFDGTHAVSTPVVTDGFTWAYAG